jgi:hypothetical protein
MHSQFIQTPFSPSESDFSQIAGSLETVPRLATFRLGTTSGSESSASVKTAQTVQSLPIWVAGQANILLIH